MSKYYKDAITVLQTVENDEQKIKKLLYEISRNHPQAVVESGKNLKYFTTPLEEALKEMVMKADNKIEAIKKYREMLPIGLKEAKDAVECIRSDWPEY